MAKRQPAYVFMRYPRTTQERKANLDKYDTMIRGKRRNLPTAYDDIFVRPQKSWKSTGRRKQYRENKEGYEWRYFPYVWDDSEQWVRYRQLYRTLQASDCYYEDVRYGGLRWFGPDFLNEG